MSFLKGVFKRKPGGTAVGNLIRGAVKQVPVVGGFLGNGAMMITEQDADKRDLTDAQYFEKYGVKKDGTRPSVIPALAQSVGAVLTGGIAALPTGPIAASTNNFLSNLNKGAEGAGDNLRQNIFKEYGVYIVGGVLALVILILALVKRK